MKLKKLLVFANDPLKEYYKKGELVDRYFNPCDFFDEIYFITLSESEIEEEKIQHTAGRAKIKIFPVGKIGPWIFSPFSKGRKRILEISHEIQPDCIRVYNAHINGFLGAIVSSKLNIPLVVSLHINPEKDIRTFLNPFTNLSRWIFWKLNKYIIEPFVLNNAGKIICVYNFIYSFAEKLCKDKNKIEVIYNRININQFKPVDRSCHSDPERSEGEESNLMYRNFNVEIPRSLRSLGMTGGQKCHFERSEKSNLKILYVGRLFEQKNPENLIKAMTDINAALTIIGDGPYRGRMERIIENLNLTKKVSIIPSVPNKEIHRYYQEADIFVSVNNYGGISKVVIEAMASGLPIVINKTLWGPPELLENTAIITEDSPDGFTEALNQLIENPALRIDLGRKNREKALKIDGKKMEQREAEVYKSLVNKI